MHVVLCVHVCGAWVAVRVLVEHCMMYEHMPHARVCMCWYPPNARPTAAHTDQCTRPQHRVWDLWSGACERALEGHNGRVNNIALSQDGQRLVSASDDTTYVWVVVWVLNTVDRLTSNG